MNFVYILVCRDGTLYTGWTNGLAGRIRAHNNGKGAKYTKGRGPVRLYYRETVPDKNSALKREARIKRLSRKEKLLLGKDFDTEYAARTFCLEKNYIFPRNEREMLAVKIKK